MMFSDFIESNRDEIVSSLTRLIQYASVFDTRNQNSALTFNENLEYALNEVLELAERKALKTKRIDKHNGIIELGTSQDCISVFCHLDVTPPSSLWSYPPFGGVISEERVYGQGILENKGPAMAVVWALIALKTLDLDLPIKIHVVLGAKGESVSPAMEYYNQIQAQPIAGFSVDSEFPVVVSESGCLHLELLIPNEDKVLSPHVLRFEGGIAIHLVPDHAYAVVECLSETSAAEWAHSISKRAKQRQLSVDSSLNGSRLQLVVHGLSVNTAESDFGRNAVVELAQLLSAHAISNTSMWRAIAHMTTAATIQTLQIPEDRTFQYSFNLGRAELVSDTYTLQLDIRYPLEFTHEMIIERLQQQLPDKWQIRLLQNSDPWLKSSDTNVCHVLKRVFQEQTGASGEQLHSRHASYGGKLKNVYGYGPRFSDQKNVKNQSEEYWTLNEYFQCIQIYAQAMLELSNTL